MSLAGRQWCRTLGEDVRMHPFLIIPLVIAAYFLTAAFVPRIRLRWGISYSGGMVLLKPRMGMVGCIGISFFIGSMVLPAFLKQPPLACMEYVTIPAFVLAGVGAMLDWVRAPIGRRRR